ncbi:hypothetical protein FSP39_025303 [Pinctada imbricata]|uniref:NADH dehydrogenase [ubiquinone] 1 alpha subcomplex subunit 5 n=1 Tax=Pinctada imbricata TaxID=66713 RepID=A0AA89C3D3_PINIB|nr:hypothetical protein FSP39_025303 [Pinctada imbricata]
MKKDGPLKCKWKVSKFEKKELADIYRRILKTIVKIPPNAPYRQNTEPIIRHRWALVENIADPNKLESAINDGQLEEVISQAKRELELSRKMLEVRAWEPLVESAPTNQWKWPPT